MIHPLQLVIAYTQLKFTMLSVFIDSVCDSSPCQNGGTCSVVAGAVSCACVPGFSGTACGSKSGLRLLHMRVINTCIRTCIFVLLF